MRDDNPHVSRAHIIDRDSGAEKHKFVDRESFLVFAFSLALFITGTCGMIGSDEYVSCTTRFSFEYEGSSRSTASSHASLQETPSHGTTGSVWRLWTTPSSPLSTCF